MPQKSTSTKEHSFETTFESVPITLDGSEVNKTNDKTTVSLINLASRKNSFTLQRLRYEGSSRADYGDHGNYQRVTESGEVIGSRGVIGELREREFRGSVARDASPAQPSPAPPSEAANAVAEWG